ncbi:hypothetical protein [Sphingomonas sp.]|jgi:hypothetical protein|uniref:hypothetical protein n=1 Tax=Sphingomonas sp. TaxID=28214 RepID=UPI002D80144B|nr:hypothetical protein [Sphingomonas sp.]HEU0044963.1 hypothetical protein [Sphingomonas sp.]
MRSIVFAAALLAGSASFAAERAPIKVTAAKTMKGTQSVQVAAFNVGFVFQSVDRAKDKTGGLIGAFGGATDAKSVLTGVDAATMQAITDAAYADFKAQLAAKGFTVVDAGPLFGDPSYAKMKPTPAPFDASVALDPKGKAKGKATYFKPSVLPGQLFTPGDVTATGMFAGFGQMAYMHNTTGFMAAAQRTGAAVIAVTYLIDFSQVKRPGAWSFKGVNVNSGIAVVDDYSRLSLFAPKGQTTLVVDEAVAVEGDFADKADTTKGAGLQKAANIAGGVAAVFGMGGLRFGKSKTFTFTAKPAFQEGAIKAASLTNTRMADQLAALR